jgi:hypothetical protein
MKRWCAAATSLSLALGVAIPAHGAEPAADEKEWNGGFGGPKNQRRADFTFGLTAGFGIGQAAGFPNEADKIDVEGFRQSTGFGSGGVGALWFGGALADWLNFGVGYAQPTLTGNGLTARGQGFVVRTEVFPLYRLGGTFRDLGAQGSFGLGISQLRDKNGVEKAMGGNMSFIALGAFHESVRFGGFRLGPTLDYSYLYSVTMDQHVVSLGARLAFYAGP